MYYMTQDNTALQLEKCTTRLNINYNNVTNSNTVSMKCLLITNYINVTNTNTVSITCLLITNYIDVTNTNTVSITCQIDN